MGLKFVTLFRSFLLPGQSWVVLLLTMLLAYFVGTQVEPNYFHPTGLTPGRVASGALSTEIANFRQNKEAVQNGANAAMLGVSNGAQLDGYTSGSTLRSVAVGGVFAQTEADRSTNVFNVRDYVPAGANICDTQQSTNYPAISAGSKALHVKVGVFSAADAGKRIVIQGAGTPVAGGSVTAIPVTGAGNFTVAPTITLSGGGATTQSVVVPYLALQSATVARGGSGYLAGRSGAVTLSLAANGGAYVVAAAVIATVSSGIVTAVQRISAKGQYATLPTNPNSLPPTAMDGTGRGATLALAWGLSGPSGFQAFGAPLGSLAVYGGSGYINAPAVTLSGGTYTIAATLGTPGVTVPSVPLATTIAAVTGPNDVSLADAAGTTLTTGSSIPSQLITWGHPDDAVFQAALNAAGAAGGGAVLVPAPRMGAYSRLSCGLASGLTKPVSQISLRGMGRGTTPLVALAPMTAVYTLNDAAWSGGYPDPSQGSDILDIALDGNGLAAYAVDALSVRGLRARGFYFRNATMADFAAGRTGLAAYEISLADGAAYSDPLLFRVASSLPAYNVQISGTDNFVTQVNAYNAQAANFYNASGDVHFTSTHAYNYPLPLNASYGYFLAGQSFGTDNIADGASIAGYLVAGYQSQLVNNRTQLAPAGVQIASLVDSILVIGSIAAGVPAANVVQQLGYPAVNTQVFLNPGASYQAYPNLALGKGSSASGRNASALGSYCTASGANSTCLGNSSSDNGRAGVIAEGTGAFSYAGDTQSTRTVLRARTSAPDFVRLTTDGSGTISTTNGHNLRTDIPVATGFSVELVASCNNGAAARWTASGLLTMQRIRSTIGFVGAKPAWTANPGGQSAAAVNLAPKTLTVDTSNGALDIEGSGSCTSGGPAVWSGRLQYTEAAAAS